MLRAPHVQEQQKLINPYIAHLAHVKPQPRFSLRPIQEYQQEWENLVGSAGEHADCPERFCQNPLRFGADRLAKPFLGGSGQAGF